MRLWIRALDAESDLNSLHLTDTRTIPHSKQKHCDVTIKMSRLYVEDHFMQKKLMVAKSPKIAISPRQPQTKCGTF